MKTAWTRLAGRAYGDRLYRYREKDMKPWDELTDDQWQQWHEYFAKDPRFVKQQQANRQNRRSSSDPNAPALGTHTAGARRFDRVREDIVRPSHHILFFSFKKDPAMYLINTT